MFAFTQKQGTLAFLFRIKDVLGIKSDSSFISLRA